MLSFLFLIAKASEFGSIDIKAYKTEPKTVILKNIEELSNLLYKSNASQKTIETLIKKIKVTTKCGVILHSCRFTSATTEQLQDAVKKAGDDRAAFKVVLDEMILRLAYRNAYIISITNNKDGTYTANITNVESGAYFSLGSSYDEWFEIYYAIRYWFAEDNQFYDHNNIQQYFPQIEEQFRPLIKQYY